MSKKNGKKKPISRAFMYSVFLAVPILPFVSLMLGWPYASTALLASGATELAFAFYAFTSGNGAYTMVPGLKDQVVRKDVLDKAERIIDAARWISFGAALLVISGIVVTVSSLSLIQPQDLSAVESIAFILVYVPLAYGTVKLFRNISFVPNKYLETGELKDYAETKNKQEEQAADKPRVGNTEQKELAVEIPTESQPASVKGVTSQTTPSDEEKKEEASNS